MIESFWIINKNNEIRLIKNFINGLNLPSDDILRKIHYNDKQNINYQKIDNNKIIIFKKYANLYIILICDEYESILGILDIIEIYINCLDEVFGKVREIDIKFNPQECLLLLDQMIVGGIVITTDTKSIIENFKSYISVEGFVSKTFLEFKNLFKK